VLHAEEPTSLSTVSCQRHTILTETLSQLKKGEIKGKCGENREIKEEIGHEYLIAQPSNGRSALVHANVGGNFKAVRSDCKQFFSVLKKQN
jgi:hypothetical protein